MHARNMPDGPEGSVVGFEVGSVVGLEVGSVVGFEVGSEVGSEVGCVVGDVVVGVVSSSPQLPSTEVTASNTINEIRNSFFIVASLITGFVHLLKYWSRAGC